MILLNSDKKEKNEIELVIKVTPEEFDAAINSAYLKNRKRINVPGFRKGKAPRKIIEKMYGIAVFINDAIDSLLPEVLKFAIEDTQFNIVGYPKVTDIDITDNDTSAHITLLASLKPEVKLGKYKGLSAPKPSVEITDEEINGQVDKVRNRNARYDSVDRPAVLGDIAVINFEGFIDGVAFEGGKGDNYELELGSGTFIPGFEDKLVGMEVSHERDIDLVFPDNYKEELAGKPVVFKVKLLELKEKQLPDADDEFAKDVSEFDTLEEYKANIKEKIKADRQAQIDETFENLIMQQIIDDMQVDLPDSMIDEHADKTMDNFSRQVSSYGMAPQQYMEMMGLDSSAFKEQMRNNAEKQVRTMLALDKIAEIEGITISDDDIEEEYKRAAEEYKTEIVKLKETVDTDTITRDLKRRAAAKIAVDSAVIEKSENNKDKESE